jgi:transposase
VFRMAKTTKKSTLPAHRPAAATPVGEITGGVDTHKDFHVAAAKDSLGRDLGTKKFPAHRAGYASLAAWLRSFGPINVVGIEGTGSYGAGLTTHLLEHDIPVLEVIRPNRQKRRRNGKSDPKDAIAAAATAQSGQDTATPKPRTGPVESVRVLTETRDHLSRARIAAINVLHALIVTAPAALRESLQDMPTTVLIRHCAQFTTPAVPAKGTRGQARTDTLTRLSQQLCDTDTALRTALHDLAITIQGHNTHITELDTRLHTLVTRITPRTSALHGVGPGRAARLLLTAGDNPDRIHDEPAFATLTGTAPMDCSSGKDQSHHRLSRAGDRQANSVLYFIVLTRLAPHQPTRHYMHTRLRPGTKMTKKHLIRCLKRYVAREIYPRLMADLTDLPHLHQQHPTTT